MSDEFLAEVREANLERMFRPRDEDDVDVPPGSIRAEILRLRDELDALEALVRKAGAGGE
jgi:hypothetical protein